MRKQDRFREEWSATLDRVGWTPKERLAWAVRTVQAPRRALTPGDRDNLRRDLGVFASGGPKGGGAEWSAEEGIAGPPEGEVRSILEDLARILQAAVKHEPVTVARRVAELSVFWDPGFQEGPYRRPPGFVLWDQDEDHDWGISARCVLSRLLVEHGHLLKECSAPELRGGPEEKCGTWFVANRPRQAYCSSRCQTRAATRAYRAAHAARQVMKKKAPKRRTGR